MIEKCAALPAACCEHMCVLNQPRRDIASVPSQLFFYMGEKSHWHRRGTRPSAPASEIGDASPIISEITWDGSL